jgi:hypothetical protein
MSYPNRILPKIAVHPAAAAARRGKAEEAFVAEAESPSAPGATRFHVTYCKVKSRKFHYKELNHISQHADLAIYYYLVF